MYNITKQIKYSSFLDQDWLKVLKGVSRRPPLHTGCSLIGMNLNKPFLHKMLKGLSKVSEHRCTLLLLMCSYPNSGTCIRPPQCVTLTLNQLRDCRFAAESPVPLFLFSLQFMAHGCCFLLQCLHSLCED